MKKPVIFIDGLDGTGKTTQSLLLCSWLHYEMKEKVAYCSFPVYESPIGRVIGRCLGRWGDRKKITLPSPEDMAVLYSLNRLEALPYLMTLKAQGHILVFNRGPYSNLFSVARRAIIDGIVWERLTETQKKFRISMILNLDREFLQKIKGDEEIVNIFLHLDPKVSMELARQKAQDTLGELPDEHERDFVLQQLASRLFTEISERTIWGFQAEPVAVSKGSLRRWQQRNDELTERNGIIRTAIGVAHVLARPFIGEEVSVFDFTRSYVFDGIEAAVKSWRDTWRGGIVFEFRELQKLEKELQPNLSETRPELMAEIHRTRPGVVEAIEASKELDRELGGRGPERE